MENYRTLFLGNKLRFLLTCDFTSPTLVKKLIFFSQVYYSEKSPSQY